MNFPRSAKWAFTLLVAASVNGAVLTSCGSGTHGESGAVTPKGTINLDALKVGVPESVVQEAVLTFVKDEKPQSKDGGKTQYLSRSKDSRGGQYIAQCKDGSCFMLQSYYMEAPISKEEALKTVTNMLPESAPPQSKVDDSQLTEGKAKNPKEKIYYGEDFLAELVHKGGETEKVQIVNVYDLSKVKGQTEETAEKADENKDGEKAADAASSESKKEASN